MCGIVGILSSRDEYLNGNVLNNMSSKLIHRGPDSDGLWIDLNDGIGFAHRRLSIIDITKSGSQPMFSADKRYVITFNGEIYNFREIKEELNKVFNINKWQGNSDTEVLLKSIEYFGLEKSLEKLRVCLLLLYGTLSLKSSYWLEIEWGKNLFTLEKLVNIFCFLQS